MRASITRVSPSSPSASRIASTSWTVSSPWRSGNTRRPSSVSDHRAAGRPGRSAVVALAATMPSASSAPEVLAHRGFGEPELGGEPGGGGGLLELEDLEHPLASRRDADIGHGTEGIAFRKDSLDKLAGERAEYRKSSLPLFAEPFVADSGRGGSMSVHAGSFEELRKTGRLLTKVGSLPVVVFWDEDRAYAIEDRCPHMGFPLHQGTVECGLVTCHWHNARFDLSSGCTLDPFADDARGFDVTIDGDDVLVDGARHRRSGPAPAPPAGAGSRRRAHARDREVRARPARSRGDAGRHRAGRARLRHTLPRGAAGAQGSRCSSRWPTSCRISTRPTARSRSRTGSSSSSRDTSNHPPRFALDPLDDGVDPERLGEWYRRFVETRSSDAAERSLATAIASGDAERRRRDDVRGGHRPRLHRRRPHHRLHEQGVRGARLCRAPTPPPPCCRRSCGRRLRLRVRKRAASGVTRTTSPRSCGAPTSACRSVWREGEAARGELTDQDVADLGWELLTDDPDAVVDALLELDGAGRDRRAARACARVRRRAAHHALPHPERPRRLERRAPRVHRRERSAPGAAAQPHARAAPRPRARRAARLPRPLPQRAGGASCPPRRRGRSTISTRAGTSRAASTRPAPSRTATSRPAATPRR